MRSTRDPHLTSNGKSAAKYRVCERVGVDAPGQVVLADPKDRDKDVVAFLDRNQPAEGDEDEAGQLAAIEALHKVAERGALHRVIPSQYQPRWHELSKQVASGSSPNQCLLDSGHC